MEHVVLSESIDISAGRSRVFALLTNLEKRLRLSSSWEVVSVKKLTRGLPDVGAKFKIRLRGEEDEVEYTSEWVELEENKKLAYRSPDANFAVTITLRDRDGGTRLNYREDAFVREEGRYNLQEARHVLQKMLGNMKAYLEVEKRFGGSVLKYLWDKVWLKMNPWERNLSKLVLIMEGALTAAAVVAIAIIVVAIRLGLIAGG